jgi:adenine-specific DNA-methyltransferase
MANEQLSTTRLLIKGENLQALRLLGRAYSSRIRAVYIDPPYNTGSDDFLYKDSFQHSSWVACLYDRLVAARDLLAEDGAIIASIGQEEIATLRQLMDLVFGLENRITIITVKRASVTGHKVINPGVVNVSEFVLIYAKNRDAWTGNPVFAERERDDRYGSFVQNRDDHCSKWRFTSVLDAFAVSHNIEKSKLRKHLGDEYEDGVTQYVYKNAMSVCQLVTVDLAGVGKDFRDAVGKSKESGDVVQVFERKGFPDVYLKNGKKVIFYTEKLTRIGDRVATAERASDIWVDVLPNDLHNEGGVELPKGKKPEALLSRLIELTTDEGDIVLDFFAGTATSAAVAEKLNRQWIAVECSDYFDEKPLRRIKNTLNGDARGISSAVNWKGGGSFKTIELESYEDALNNLRLHRSRAQELALEAMSPEAREQYQLGYMLDLEATGSQSLLNVSAFTDPWNYTLEIASSTVGETRSVKLDLVTTFNWLLGLTVLAQGGGPDKKSGGVIWVEATNPEGEKVLVLWRNTSEVDADALNVWCKKQKVKVQDGEFALIYVNGDHHLENLRREDQTWKVRLTDEEFPKLMWEGCE